MANHRQPYRHLPLRRALLLLSLGLAALPSWADDDCDAPVNRWQSREAVRQMAAAQGWQIQRLKIDDGCYALRGTDAQGLAFKAKIDPETLKVLKMKREAQQRSREREHEHERDDKGEAPQGRPRPAERAPASSPMLNPGSAPRGQNE